MAILAGLGEVLCTLECLYFYFEPSAIPSLLRSLNRAAKRLNLRHRWPKHLEEVLGKQGGEGGGFPSAFFFDSEKNCKNPQPPLLRLASPGAGGASEWNDGLCVR